MSRPLKALKLIFLTAVLILPAIAMTVLTETGRFTASGTAMLSVADDGDGDLDHACCAAVAGTLPSRAGFRAECFRLISHPSGLREPLSRHASLRAPPGA